MVDHVPRGVVRRAARRSEMQDMFAVQHACVRSVTIRASIDLHRRSTRAQELSRLAHGSARSERLYRVRHRRLESWTPSQERRGLCQEPDTTSASNAQKVDDGTLSVFGPKHTVGKVDALPYRAAIGGRQAVSWWLSGPPGPESRSMTSDMIR